MCDSVQNRAAAPYGAHQPCSPAPLSTHILTAVVCASAGDIRADHGWTWWAIYWYCDGTHRLAGYACAESLSYLPPHPGASRQCSSYVCAQVVWCLDVQVVRTCNTVLWFAVCPRTVCVSSYWCLGCRVGAYHLPWYVFKLSSKFFDPSTGVSFGANGVRFTVPNRSRYSRQPKK
jgi:hypothetical protein